MPVRWKVEDFKRGELFQFFLEDIIVNPKENGRHVEPDIEWLIADIRTNGQDTPVEVRNDGGRPVLVFGYQRYRAIKALNERYPTEGPNGGPRRLLCRYKDLTAEEAFRANISENRMRNDVLPIDDAHNIKRLINVYNYTPDQVLQLYFPTNPQGKEREDAQRWVRERMALIGLAPTAEQAMREGRMKLHAGIALNQLPEAKQEELAARPGPIKIKDVRAAAPLAPAPGYTPTFSEKYGEIQIGPATPPAKHSLAGTGIDPDWNEADDEAGNSALGDGQEDDRPTLVEKFQSPRNLASDMLLSLSEAMWHPDGANHFDGSLAVFADAVLDAAAQASIGYDWPEDVLEAMEAYRKARVN